MLPRWHKLILSAIIVALLAVAMPTTPAAAQCQGRTGIDIVPTIDWIGFIPIPVARITLLLDSCRTQQLVDGMRRAQGPINDASVATQIVNETINVIGRGNVLSKLKGITSIAVIVTGIAQFAASIGPETINSVHERGGRKGVFFRFWVSPKFAFPYGITFWHQ